MKISPTQAVRIDGRDFATPLDASLHVLWLIQRLCHFKPKSRIGEPCDGFRFREGIVEARKLLKHLGCETDGNPPSLPAANWQPQPDSPGYWWMANGPRGEPALVEVDNELSVWWFGNECETAASRIQDSLWLKADITTPPAP